MTDRVYKTILNENQIEIEIKKSRFIAHAKHCRNEEESLEFLDSIRRDHRQATHNCYAYVNEKNKSIQRYSDDGEPQGTAGLPILDVIKKEDLTNICVVVTRYFGGVKLGASGLIRAYAGATSDCIQSADLVEIKKFNKLRVTIDYTYLGMLDNYFSKENYFEIDRKYDTKVHIDFYILKSELEKFTSDIVNMTSDNCEIEKLGEFILPEKNRKVLRI